MSKSTISAPSKLFEMFPDQEAAQVYLEARLWPNGVKLPGLRAWASGYHGARAGGYYRCNQCKEDFTVRTGTVFERSHVPLHKWLYAMYLLVTARKGISSMQLAKEIGITQKSAWFVLQRLREACGNDNLAVLRGIVEIDEMYVGGKQESKRGTRTRKVAIKGQRVVALSERRLCSGYVNEDGRTVAMPIPDTSRYTLSHAVHNTVELGSTIHTDEHIGYSKLGGDYTHETINHSRGEYVRDGVTTNSIEAVWAVMRRGFTASITTPARSICIATWTSSLSALTRVTCPGIRSTG